MTDNESMYLLNNGMNPADIVKNDTMQMQGPGSPSNDATIASMRWESQQLIYELYKVLGAYEVKITEGNVEFYRNPDGPKAMMNKQGVDTIVGIIRGTVNQVTSLSNVEDDEANEYIRQTLYAIIRILAMNTERFGIQTEDMTTIMSICKGIVFFQIKRAVGGHESDKCNTQSVEHNVQQHTTYGGSGVNNGGFSFNPMKWGRR
jgi:hypothetical protein